MTENLDRKWKTFSVSLVAVLALSVLGTLLAATGVTAVQMRRMARLEMARKASDMARFMARTSFVPVSLEDMPTLERVARVYLDDPDLIRLSVSDSSGRVLLSRETGAARAGGGEITVAHEIAPPAEARDSRASPPVGTVTVTLSLARVYGIVSGALGWIMLACAAMLLGSAGTGLWLIERMTRRLQALVGEARMSEELRRSNQELEQFAFVASHDLQEPLRKVIGFCQLLERRYAPVIGPEGVELMGFIIDGAGRMNSLVKDLLSFARVGTQGRPFAPTDTGTVVKEALALMEEPIRKSGAKVTAGALPTVLADAVQLGQLFQNLISNAVKFRDQCPPEVGLSAQRQDDWWTFCVRDNGIGIEAQYLDRIFEMFKRLHPKEKYPGTGIGLAICKKIVERHGGRIWVESTPGRGTAFFFTLKAEGKTSTS